VCVCIYDVFFTRVFFLVSLVCLLSFFLCFFKSCSDVLFDGDWMLARFCYVDAKCSLALCNLLIWFC